MSIFGVASRSSALAFRLRAAPSFQRRGLITLKEVKYTATARASGAGRNGSVESNDGTATPLDLKLNLPKALGGEGKGHNPEQLFASGYAACFLGALQAVAAQQGKTSAIQGAKISTQVHIGPPTDQPGFGLAVDITVEGVQDQELIDATHAFCPYSRALNYGAVVKVFKA